MATRHKPSRGQSGPEIEIGDPFGEYEKQGGAEPGATESGDLQSREFGVPQADIPGGLNHLVNREAVVTKPAHKGFQPADYHKFHGVPPQDLEGYTYPAKADEVGQVPRPEKEPKRIDYAVPVYEVQDPDRPHVRKASACFNVNVNGAGSEPSRICNRDDNRVSIQVLNEDSTTDIRISDQRAELLVASAQGTGPAGQGALIWHGTNSYTEIESQEELWAITTTTAVTARLSVIIVTEVQEA